MVKYRHKGTDSKLEHKTFNLGGLGRLARIVCLEIGADSNVYRSITPPAVGKTAKTHLVIKTQPAIICYLPDRQ